jgi:16S rRNA (adenine1518-N6/adenine1519-N6)-dimethyltransferase
MLLMLQYEAAVRIVSGAGSRESSPLGITLAALGNTSMPRRVPRGAFSPRPRVDSAIVEILVSGAHADLPRDEKWRRMLAGSFAQRRKTLSNNWAASFGIPRERAVSILAAHGHKPLLRPEETPLEAWLDLHRDPNLTV